MTKNKSTFKPGAIVRSVQNNMVFPSTSNYDTFIGSIEEGEHALVLAVHEERLEDSWGWDFGLAGKILWKGQVVYVMLCRDEGDHSRYVVVA